MKIGKYITCGLVALLLTACGESVEHKMQQAQIALSSGRPDAALTYAQQVLEERPNDSDALMLMAKAHLRLRQFAESKKLLEQLAAASPQAIEPRQELLNLALASMSDLIGASEFTTNVDLIEKFTSAKELGHLQADWFNSDGKEPATADYARARLLILDALRIERFLKEEETRIRGETGLNDSSAQVSSATIDEQRRQIRNMHDAAERHLAAALTTDPSHYAAAGHYARLMRKREAWSEIWVLAAKMEKHKGIPAALAAELVSDVLNIPDRLHTIESRMKVARNLLDAVSDAGRASVAWKVVRSRLYLREGDSKQALALAEECFRAQPKDADVRYTYACALFETKQFQLAKSLLQTLAIEKRDSEQVQLLYGLTLIETGDGILAAEALRRVNDLDPNNQIARGALVKLLAQDRSGMSVVLEDINKLYVSKPSDPDAIRFKFAAEVAANSLTGVRNLLNAVEGITPRLMGHLRVLIDGYIYLNETDKALVFAKELVEIAADQVDSHLLLARVHLLRKTPDEAKRVLVNVREKFPDSPNVSEFLAQLYLMQGDYDRSIEIGKEIVAASPEHTNARLLLAQSYAQLSMAEEGLDQIKEILDRQPNDARALELAASIHRMTGQHDLAKAYLEKIDESQIDETKYPGVLAQLKLQKGEVAEAMAICNRAIAANIIDPRVRLTLANLHAHSQNVGEQEVHLTAYIRENPSDFQGYMMLARFYGANNPERGVSQLHALRASNDTLARMAQANLLRAMNRAEDAVNVLAEIHPRLLERRDPLTWTFTRQLAQALIHRDRSNAAAVRLYDSLIDRNIKAARAMLVQTEMQWSQLDDAARVARIKQVEPKLSADDLMAVASTVSFYGVLNRLDLALALVERWHQQLPKEATILLMRANLFAALGRLEEEIATCKQAIALEPDAPGRYVRLAEAYIRATRFPEAQATFDQMAQISTGAKVSALWAKSSLFTSLGLRKSALAVLEELKSASTATDPRVLLALGQGLAAVGREADAASQLALIPSHARDQYPSAQVLLARIETRAGNREQAKARLQRLMENPNARIAAASELLKTSVSAAEDDSILEWSADAMSRPGLPASVYAPWMMMRLTKLVRDARWDEVASSLNDAVKIAPESHAWAAARILVMIHQNKLDEAKRAFAEATALHTHRYGALLAMGLGLPAIKIESPDASHDLFDAMIRRDAAAAGESLKRLDLPDTGLFISDLRQEIDKLAAADEKTTQLWRMTALANLAIELKMHPIAEATCTAMILQQADFTPAHAVRIIAITAQRKSSEVESGNALLSVPDSTLAHWLRIIEHQTKREYPQAIEQALKVLARDPGHVRTSLHLVPLYRQAGQMPQAIQLLTDMYASATGLTKAIVGNDLAYSLIQGDSPDIERAHQIALTIANTYPATGAFRDTLGWIEHLRGRHQEALSHLNAAVIANPASISSQYHLGETYKSLGNIQWARMHLEVAAAEKSLTPDAVKARESLAALSTPP